MVDFAKQRKVRGKPGLVDAHGGSIGSGSIGSGAVVPVPMTPERRMAAAQLNLAKSVADYLALCEGMDAVQCVATEAGCQITAFSTKMCDEAEREPWQGDAECEPS